ncbi:Beta-lactamase enzyme family protein [Fodinibius roseus]|uniref:Beta-lactamase enzyme family protein n=1 Tax=Fodinibius roseus TaxID=1194090 RepID=A0A1M4XD36_9BACT|nr:serine hydrolase [Fodinibius roseus]SHE91447.1 Beta-lactamase enzyme family protein [Fodinibius roseus]
MRILKFIGVAVGTLLLVFLIVFGFNPNALFTLFENSDDLQEGQEWVSKTTSLKGLTEYIGEHPRIAAVVSRSATNPDTVISYGAGQPHTMGTLSNFLLITTYARLVENDSLDPGEPIPLKEVDAYQLPYIDATNHEDAKTALRSEGAVTSDSEVALGDLIQAGIIFNDLAISDYLYYRLGEEAISHTYEQLKLRHTDRPLPFSGLYITINPATHDTTAQAHLQYLDRLSGQEFRDMVLTNAQKYQSDTAFRNRIDELFNASQGLAMQFTDRRDALTFFPQSTAGELSGLMIRLQQDQLLSPAVSKRIRDIMDWPLERQSLNNDFEFYGAIYDNRMGLLNGLDYGASTYSQEPFGQAVFFDSLQVGLWFHMSSNLMHQDYQQRLMWDPALRETTLRQLNRKF